LPLKLFISKSANDASGLPSMF